MATSAPLLDTFTAQKMKFSMKDFFSKCDQIRSFLLGNYLVVNYLPNQTSLKTEEKN